MASNDQDQTADSDDDGTATLFQIKLEVITKDFMSQKGGQSKGMFSVNVNTLEEFLKCIWGLVEQHIQREILFNTSNERYEWANYELDVESSDRFIIFYDKSSKRSFELTSINNRMLNSWTKKSGQYFW